LQLSRMNKFRDLSCRMRTTVSNIILYLLRVDLHDLIKHTEKTVEKDDFCNG
jgi:hypothetical protein